MNNNVMFFTIHVDDVDRAMRFYQQVFQWRFEPWGPPGFFLITTGKPEDRGIRGAMHKRQEPLGNGGFNGFECSIAVPNLDSTMKLIASNGGTITMPRVGIPTVGELCKCKDPEGNVICVIQYEPEHWKNEMQVR